MDADFRAAASQPDVLPEKSDERRVRRSALEGGGAEKRWGEAG
jgi:hypothetical protein